MNFDWTQLSFIIGNLVGALIKARPNLGIWKDKYIPGAIFVVMLALQFLRAALDAATVPPAAIEGAAYAYAGFWGGFGGMVLEALKQAGLAVLLHQLKKQATKPV